MIVIVKLNIKVQLIFLVITAKNLLINLQVIYLIIIFVQWNAEQKVCQNLLKVKNSQKLLKIGPNVIDVVGQKFQKYLSFIISIEIKLIIL